MSSINDENQLKKCLEEIIKLIEQTNIEESIYSNDNDNKHNSNKLLFDKLTNLINDKLKNSLTLLSNKTRQYFLNLFKDYNYSYDNGCFNETLKKYIIKQLLIDLQAINESFDAFQAAFNGNLSIVKEFVEKYPKYKDISGIWGTTLLYSSARNNHINIVKYLIEQANCNVNVQNKEHYSEYNQLNPTSGSTPLHAAAYYGHLDILKLLIEYNGDYFILNDANETPVYNGLLRQNIRLFFQDYLIISYTNSTDKIPRCTILNDYTIINDSIWEYKFIDSDQWILFEQNQSNQFQKFLLYQTNINYKKQFLIKINNHYYLSSLIKFLSIDQSEQHHLWIRCRGYSILNFNLYSKWQILFEKNSSSKTNKTSLLDVFNIDDNPHTPIKIIFNHWYNANNDLNQQLDHANNYRKKLLNIRLPFINDDLYEFNLQNYSFHNNDNTITGFIRWIPIFISMNDQTIIDNFQPVDHLNLIPKYRM